jgi:hypothetical protein
VKQFGNLQSSVGFSLLVSFFRSCARVAGGRVPGLLKRYPATTPIFFGTFEFSWWIDFCVCVLFAVFVLA